MANGWWHFDRLYKDTFSNKWMGYSGRYVYVVGNAVIRAYDTYMLEPYFTNTESLIRPEDRIQILSDDVVYHDIDYSTYQTSAHHIELVNNDIYITSGEQFTIISRYNFSGFLEHIYTPEIMQSNIHFYNGKLWMVGESLTNYKHTVYSYDVITKTWNSLLLPVRHQVANHYISDDKAGNVLITQHNNLSVTKINSYTNTFTNTIRLDDGTGANRYPRWIHTNSSHKVYVGSINGMVSIVDTSINTVDHQHNALGTCLGFVEDGTYLWYSTGNNLVRQKVSDNTVRILTNSPSHNGLTIDGSVMFNTDAFNEGYNVNKVVKTIGHNYQTVENNIEVTKSVGEYIFTANNNTVYAFRNDSKFYRNVYTKVNATGMVSSGPYDYTGD